ncbi:hypothetical protein B296_00059207, partial [Ensete ventricosum]
SVTRTLDELPSHRPKLGPMPKLGLGSMSGLRIPNCIVLTLTQCLDLTLANHLIVICHSESCINRL